MMLSERDNRVLNLIHKFGNVSTSQIQVLCGFPKGSACRRRLGQLYENKLVKKSKRNMGAENIFYIDKLLRYAEHRLKLVDFYIALVKFAEQSSSVKLLRFDVEPVDYGEVIPDAYVEIAVSGDKYKIFVEVHMSYEYQAFDQAKYEKLYCVWKDKVFPRVVILSERTVKIQQSDIKYIVLGGNYKIYEIFK